MLGIPLVAEFGTEHIEKAICMISVAIFSENQRKKLERSVKLKLGEGIEQHLIDQQPSSVK